MAASQGLAEGAVLQDTYRIVRRIGRGGMGEVYEATHARLAGRYAVKLLLEEIAANPEAFARFRREAEVTSALRHPNIIQVIDFNEMTDGTPYLVMEFLEGIELSREIERVGQLSVDRVQEILRQTSSALTAAHNRGVVHRDLKPENLFLARVEGEDHEVVKVLDFGISKVKEATTKLTKESALLGTAHYMAPEQALGDVDQIDARSDQFSLGAIVYQMLAGREPFWGDSVAAVVYQVVHKQPPALPTVNPAVSRPVAAVVERAMAKKRDERFPSMRDFHQAFLAAMRAPAGAAAPAAINGPTPVAAHTPPPVLRAPAAPAVMVLPQLSPPQPRAAARPPVRLANKKRETTLGATAGETLSGPELLLGNRRRNMAAAAGAAALVLVVAVVALRSGKDEPSQPAPTVVAEVKPPAAVSAAPTAPAAPAPAPAAAPTPAPAPAAAPAPAPAPAPSSIVTVRLEGVPEGAHVLLDGARTTNPLRLYREARNHVIRVVAPGYEPHEQRVSAAEDATLTVSLTPLSPPPPREREREPARSARRPAGRGGDDMLLGL